MPSRVSLPRRHNARGSDAQRTGQQGLPLHFRVNDPAGPLGDLPPEDETTQAILRGM